MNLRPIPDEFQVAFSFAGQQRQMVHNIAQAVETRLGESSVFFDEWFKHYISGQDADLLLQRIYREQSKLVIVCVSEEYGEKCWTLAEFEAIRARMMHARTQASGGGRLGTLPIRFDDGVVEGIQPNTITVDFRNSNPTDIADLIVARLRIFDSGPEQDINEVHSWPENKPSLEWPVANHNSVREVFTRFLTNSEERRFLPLTGPSESGKSHLTKLMLSNALVIPDLACGRFDFKGTTDMGDELNSFTQNLDVPPPSSDFRLNESLSQILTELRLKSKPTLLIFDTYESAGTAADWVERQLLRNIIRDKWLRVVIAGQQVPLNSWEPITYPVITLAYPKPSDWFDYSKLHRPGLKIENVEQICQLAPYKTSILSQLFGPEM